MKLDSKQYYLTNYHRCFYKLLVFIFCVQLPFLLSLQAQVKKEKTEKEPSQSSPSPLISFSPAISIPDRPEKKRDLMNSNTRSQSSSPIISISRKSSAFSSYYRPNPLSNQKVELSPPPSFLSPFGGNERQQTEKIERKKPVPSKEKKETRLEPDPPSPPSAEPKIQEEITATPPSISPEKSKEVSIPKKEEKIIISPFLQWVNRTKEAEEIARKEHELYQLKKAAEQKVIKTEEDILLKIRYPYIGHTPFPDKEGSAVIYSNPQK